MIAAQTLGELVDAIASREPAPGAGVAAAAALALGIACARKAAAITLKHHPELPDLIRDDARLAELADQALRLGDRDASCFRAAIGHDEQAEAKLIEGGEQLLMLAAEAREAIASISAQSDPMMRNDILAADVLIDAAATIVRANLAENQESAA